MKQKILSICLAALILFGALLSVPLSKYNVNALVTNVLYEIDFESNVKLNYTTGVVTIPSTVDLVQGKYIETHGSSSDSNHRASEIKYGGNSISLPAGRYKIDYKFFEMVQLTKSQYLELDRFSQ